MRRLMGVELTRLRWRRVVQVLAVLAVVVPVLVFAITAWNTRPVTDAERAGVQAQIERDTASSEDDLRACLADPESQGIPADEDPEEVCAEWYTPQLQWYGLREPLDLVNERESGSGAVLIALLTVLLVLAGTTFAGHDWNTGSMSNQLLFEPRRVRMWLAKGLVVALAGAALTAVVLAAYWTGLWALAAGRGLDPSSHSVWEGYQQGLRGTVLAALCALAAYAVTMLFRSTVVTLGVLFGLSILTPLLMALIAFPNNERWMPQTNLAAVILDGTTYYGEMSCTSDSLGNQECSSNERELSLAGGSAYLLGLLALAAVPSVLTFRRRDVP
jgi:ABC-2 type transport system permease protein